MPTRTASPKSAQKQPTPAEATTRSPLTQFQEQLCDLAGDIILYGGHNDSVQSLLISCMDHEWRRRTAGEDPAKQEKDVMKYVHNRYSDWERKLIRSWADKPSAAEEPSKADRDTETSVSERVRSTVRGELQTRFQDFLGSASPEELRLLRDVLMSAESTRGHEESIPLAEAFSYEIDRGAGYIRVPHKHEKLVREYLELIEKGEEHRARAV